MMNQAEEAAYRRMRAERDEWKRKYEALSGRTLLFEGKAVITVEGLRLDRPFNVELKALSR